MCQPGITFDRRRRGRRTGCVCGLAAIGFMMVSGAVAQPQLFINEIDVDQFGTDTREFVEIYNGGNETIDFDFNPHVLVLFNGADDMLPVIDGSYSATTLTGLLPPGAFLVLGGVQTPNVDILIGNGGSNLLQNGTDAVAIYVGTANDWVGQRAPTTIGLVDAIVYGTDDDDDPALWASLGQSRQYDEWNEQGNVGAVFSIARTPDGGFWETGATPTPGTSNDASPPVFALPGATLLHRNPPTQILVELVGQGGVGTLRFRVRSTPLNGTLFHNGQAITGSGGTTLPLVVTGVLSYLPQTGFASVDAFEFDVVDGLDRISAAERQELAVQAGGVVITEIMHTPGTFFDPQDQRVYEFVEIFNLTGSAVPLTRFDGNLRSAVDTTDNLMTNGQPAVIPARSARIIAPGGLTESSDRDFACEWGLDESEIVRVPHEVYENLFNGSRLLLFGAGGTLLDAVYLNPPNFWTPVPGGSQSVKEAFLDICGGTLNTIGNDCVVVWPYSGPENQLGLRTSHSGAGLGSPGYVPSGLATNFQPLPPCLPPPVGACCLSSGVCGAMTVDQCAARGGTYAGDYVTCSAAPKCPPPPTGACCTSNGSCIETDSESCSIAGGNYHGHHLTCTQVACTSQISLVINEIEYTQAGADSAEYIEIYGRPGWDLLGYSIILYNGDPSQRRDYRTILLAGKVPPDGFFVVGSAEVPNVDMIAFATDGMQNGEPDGVVLMDPLNRVVEAWAYGGSFLAEDGAAAGAILRDMQVVDRMNETSGPRDEVTLQRIPNGIGPWMMTTDGGLGRDGTPGSTNAHPLPAAHGACCQPDGACLPFLEPQSCAAPQGTYQGDATLCDSPCVIQTGACCLPNGECVSTDPIDCQIELGTFHGVGVFCVAVGPCPQPPLGACCLAGGNCFTEDLFDCERVAGDYQGHGTTCDGVGGCGTAFPFSINEIHRNDIGVDDREFIEIRGPGGTSLFNLTVVEIEGDYSVAGQEGRIDSIWTMDGFAMPGDGLFVLGDQAIDERDLTLGETNQIENGTATYLLIENFDLANFPLGTDIDVDNDGVADPGTNLGGILDAVAFADAGIDGVPPQVDRTYYNAVTVGPAGTSAPAGVARRVDGLDTESPSDFCQLGLAGNGSDGQPRATPGQNNVCVPCGILGDGDLDGEITLYDFGRLQMCRTEGLGPIDPPVYPLFCRCHDFDADGDIDLDDFRRFSQAALSIHP